jgi:3-methyladenine DNA glycosylase AlkD
VDQGKQQDHFRTDAEFWGVRMGSVFALAKEFIGLPVAEIDELLRSPVHEVRVGALSVMGKRASAKKTTEADLAALYELYMARIDLINTWDLVDLCAHHVLGRHLADKPRTPLYDLAASPDWWKRRIAIFATLHFLRDGDLTDTWSLADLLAEDPHDLVQKTVGGLAREAGKHDPARLHTFLDTHAATAPKVMLTQAMEHLDKPTKAAYRARR